MNVDDALILKLENLAKLNLSDEERETLKHDLSKITEMFSAISQIDTDGVKPLIHMTDAVNALRKDESKNTLTVEEIREIAPKMIGRHFAVPKVIE